MLLENKWFINAAQYNGIYHQDVRNEPFEILMRRHDKKILYVNPNQPAMNTTMQRSVTHKPYESNSRYYMYENRDTMH